MVTSSKCEDGIQVMRLGKWSVILFIGGKPACTNWDLVLEILVQNLQSERMKTKEE
jgi:hypothetical protein